MKYKETENLKRLQEFVDEMKNTSSLNEKKDIIDSVKNDEFITEALNYTYDPYKKYYVTSKTCKKMSHLADDVLTSIVGDNPNDSFFSLLDHLNERLFTGHDSITNVVSYINAYPEFKDLFYSIIDRNLEIRASESVINKVIPNLIPTFDVALATKYEPKFCDFENEVWLASRKLDGVRCIIRKEGDNVTAYSRQGNEFTTLQKVLDDVLYISKEISWHDDFVLDGEICLMDENGNEDFQGIMKQIKRKDHTIENPKYIIFDCISIEEFDSKEGDILLSERLQRLPELDGVFSDAKTLSILDQVFIEDERQLSDMITDAETNGFEGVMLRKDSTYEGKRSKNLLKCKKFHDAEYKVLDVDFDEHRIIREGKEVVIPMLANVIIEHKGFKVSVGSGWNQEQRIKYQANPEQLIGKTITVQYFEETKNQEGGISLRFPTVKHVYENGRNV
jgi:DNA ligase-1